MHDNNEVIRHDKNNEKIGTCNGNSVMKANVGWCFAGNIYKPFSERIIPEQVCDDGSFMAPQP